MIAFASTRDVARARTLSLSEALQQGLAPDGGLYVPLEWPSLAPSADPEDLPALAAQVLAPFAAGDVLAGELAQIVREAFDFPVPVTPVDTAQRLSVLEVFHGPTAAFKDVGARFLARALGRLRRKASKPLMILVATSGDTGGAVAAAFHQQPGIDVSVLFPKGLVSPTQQQQLTCWGGNVRSFAVAGRFDDCQRMVKEAFAERALGQRFELSSANSINLGRLLPQMIYYWSSSLALARAHGAPVSYVIPSGNLGNATACVWARRLGAPIGSIVLAHNANRTMPDYWQSGTLRVRESLATISSAMDVGNPSNLERLRALYPEWSALHTAVRACSIDDTATRARIVEDFRRFGRIWCPHTAVAAEAFARLTPAERGTGPWVLVATAHPAKFREIVEPLIGQQVPLPASLAQLFARPVAFTEIPPTLAALAAAL